MILAMWDVPVIVNRVSRKSLSNVIMDTSVVNIDQCLGCHIDGRRNVGSISFGIQCGIASQKM